MRTLGLFALLLALMPALADDPVKQDPAPKPEGKADVKKDWSDFSRLIHSIVVKELPKEIEDKSGWGQIVPLTEPLRFPNLPRTRVKAGNKEGYPNGLWKKYKILFEEPAKNIKIVVRDFSKIDAKNFRLALDADASVVGEGEIQNWTNGIRLGQVAGQADATLGLGMLFKVNVTLDPKSILALKIDPKLDELKVDIKEFNVRKVTAVGGVLELGEESNKAVAAYLKDGLQTAVKTFEPQIKNLANRVLDNALKEGRGNISAGALFKIAPTAKEPPAKEKNP